jgi:hypothetical protein
MVLFWYSSGQPAENHESTQDSCVPAEIRTRDLWNRSQKALDDISFLTYSTTAEYSVFQCYPVTEFCFCTTETPSSGQISNESHVKNTFHFKSGTMD